MKIKINESTLNRMIRECVVRSLKKIYEDTDFANVWGDENFDAHHTAHGAVPGGRYIDDMQGYIDRQGLNMRSASKFQKINARPAQPGEQVTTYKQDGSVETTNTANEGDWIANNIETPEQKWIIPASKFWKKYETVEGQPGVYKPKGGPMLAGKTGEDISFKAPWGEKMDIRKGGYLMQTPDPVTGKGDPNDIYGIQDDDFQSTYRFNEGRIREIVNEAIKKAIREMTPDYYAQQAQKAQRATTGVRGAVNRVFNPKLYKKAKRQGDQFQDMTVDHPEDQWQIQDSGYADAGHISQGYHMANTRTGEIRRFNDYYNNGTLPFRGQAVNGAPGSGIGQNDAGYLNDKFGSKEGWNAPRK